MIDTLKIVGRVFLAGIVAGITLGLAVVALIAVVGGAFWLFSALVGIVF